MTELKKFAVCGDSFAAAVTEEPVAGKIYKENSGLSGTHFSELLCDSIGYQPVHLARGGMSNGGIRLQVETAINQQVDFIYAITTGTDRVEFRAAGADQRPFNWRRASTEITHSYHGDISCLNPAVGSNIIHSETLSSLVRRTYEQPDSPSDAQVHAWEQYVTHLYEPELKHRQDSWIFSSLITLLRRSDIPFLLIDVSDFRKYPDIRVDYDNRVLDGAAHQHINPRYYQDESMSRYHTSVKAQEILAWHTEKYLKQENLLNHV